ncbi:hypothetical protein IQ226_00895 [Dolichospermum sp. LEGE 00240]|jgi:hypothetical protein|uniref:hypothetical protein n=1 Tax=Aphanizomenonaceae TaxID=1892259 RepID=UPI0018814215|nr:MULTISPECIES: hypothetical protein [Aphanizomenonaceae]MBE9247782.1 hypothetical protein [Dolichospermum sp. LEGE 00240]MDB9310493.1 hypothetical protein [Aphanizomenon sp. CS-733/32]MDM3848928.1 hypothetical protein [Aphanizomenon gracile PMC627.10]MDM3858494.1 hypothetical protein [Aphanizomenon gracile PMC644.10]
MVHQMFKRLIQWLKKIFRHLFGGKQNLTLSREEVPTQVAPPLSDTDLEFLFTELLEGVHQVKGQAWAQKWLHNLEHRVSTEQWLEWLMRFGDRLLASAKPHNELAARLVQLGELGVGEIGNLSYDIGMKVLTLNPGEPIWEYDGPDVVESNPLVSANTEENLSEGEYKTVTLDELLMMLQQDENLCEQISQQLGVETQNPEEIIQALVNQYNEANEPSV